MAKKFRIGVIGSTGRGNYGHGLDTAWFDFPNTEIVAVADDNKEGLAKAAALLKVDRTFTDYRDMLGKAKLDIVAICPRWVDQHYDMALAAVKRGIHAYMEKPLCRTLEEADELVRVCEQTHAKITVALPTHYSPQISTVKNLIQSGKLGRILEYRARGKEDRRGGGEDLWVLGTHVIDLLLTFGGQPKWCFAHVTQDGRPVTKADVYDGAEGIGPLAGNGISATYGLVSGATMTFHSYGHAGSRKPQRYGVKIYGSAGVAGIVEGTLPPVTYLPDPSWSPGRSGQQWQKVSTAGIDKPEPLSGKKFEARHMLAIEDFLAAIEDNREPKCNIYRGRAITEMIAAIFESHRQGRPVPLPLENRRNPLTLL